LRTAGPYAVFGASGRPVSYVFPHLSSCTPPGAGAGAALKGGGPGSVAATTRGAGADCGGAAYCVSTCCPPRVSATARRATTRVATSAVLDRAASMRPSRSASSSGLLAPTVTHGSAWLPPALIV